MGQRLGLSQSMVSWVWRAFGLAPGQQDSWNLCQGSLFVAKVCDIAGLYLDPTEGAMALCLGEQGPDPGIAPHRCPRCDST